MTYNFNNICKKYKLDDTLYKIGEITREMLTKRESVRYIPFSKKYGRIIFSKGGMHVTPWDLMGLAYKLICNSNDYKYKSINDDKELLILLSEYKRYDDDISGKKLDILDEEDTLLFIMFGHSQQQFWYQNIGQIITQFNRNTEILLYIWKHIGSSINIDQIVYDKLGFNSDILNKILVCLLALGLQETDLSNKEIFDFLKNSMPDYIYNNVEKVIDLYSANYELFRKEKTLKENLFFTKPIIETDTNKRLIINHYLLVKLLSDGLYWIIRNHFNDKKSQEFINDFGRAFEIYLKDVLDYYLSEKSYYQPTNTKNHKIADWIIETDKFFIILEQKSTIASLTLKTAYPNMNNLRKYIEKFSEAFDQLNETEKAYKSKIGCKKVVKLIVHYENLHVQTVLKYEIQKGRNNNQEDLNIFFINIYELERLIYVLKNDIDIFYKVLERMIKVSSEFSGESREFGQIMDEMKIKENDYLTNKKNHFKNILSNLKADL